MSFDMGGFSGSIISVGGALLIAYLSFRAGVKKESADKQERERQRDAVAKRIAKIVSGRMALILVALTEFVMNDNREGIRNMSLSKGVPDDLIINYLNSDIITEIYDMWAPAEVLYHRVAGDGPEMSGRTWVQLRERTAPVLRDFQMTYLNLRKYAGIHQSNDAEKHDTVKAGE